MPSAESTNATHSRYDSCDPKYLRDLRQAAGMEVEALARTACLSVAQVRALESDAGGDFFYSHTIRRQAYKRVLMILGAEPPTVEVPEVLRDAHQVADAHLNTLDQIVAMSHQPPINFTWLDRLREGLGSLSQHKQVLGALSFLVAAVVLFVLYGPLNLFPPSTVVSVPAPQPTEAAVAPVASVAAPAEVVASAAVVVASAPEVVASVPAQSTAAVAASAASSSACAFSTEAMPQAAPFVARKEGTYVYVVSNANVELCVVDGSKQATVLQMKAGENRTVPGIAPWQISGTNLQQVQIYFQGGRVTLPDDVSRRLKLVELPITR
jgi:hypothetical protein